MQLFTLFRSQNKGLISTPKFTPNSFYNSLPYFTEKPANPWKHYILLRAFSLFYTSLKFRIPPSPPKKTFYLITNRTFSFSFVFRSFSFEQCLKPLPLSLPLKHISTKKSVRKNFSDGNFLRFLCIFKHPPHNTGPLSIVHQKAILFQAASIRIFLPRTRFLRPANQWNVHLAKTRSSKMSIRCL